MYFFLAFGIISKVVLTLIINRLSYFIPPGIPNIVIQ